MSRIAATAPCDVLHTRIGRPNRTVPFRLPGASSLLKQAGYQKPKSGALLDGLISVIKSLFIDEERCAWKDQPRRCKYSEWAMERQASWHRMMLSSLVMEETNQPVFHYAHCRTASSRPLLPGSFASHSGVARLVFNGALPTRAFGGRALRARRRLAGHLPASPPSLTRKRSGYYSENPIEIAKFMRA